MNMKLAFLWAILLIGVGNIAALVSSVGYGQPAYWGLTDEAILDELRQIYPVYYKSDASSKVRHDLLDVGLRYLVTRRVIPYPILAPNVAYVPAIGTTCMDYGDYSVFVDVHRGEITAVVGRSHCISLHCENPTQNEQLDRIIQTIGFVEMSRFLMSEMPNIGARLLTPSGISFDPIEPYRRF